jgi:hypothetical protein
MAQRFGPSGLGGNCPYVLVFLCPPEPFGHRWFELVVALPAAFSSTCGWPGRRSTSRAESSASLVS